MKISLIQIEEVVCKPFELPKQSKPFKTEDIIKYLKDKGHIKKIKNKPIENE